MNGEQKSSIRFNLILPRILTWLRSYPLTSTISLPPGKLQSAASYESGEDSPAVIAGVTDSNAVNSSGVSPESSLVEADSSSSSVPPSDDLSQLRSQRPIGRNVLKHPWLVALLVSGSTGVGALLWLTILPPLPNCQRLSPLATDSERLYCADQAVRQGDIKQLLIALKTVSQWPQDHPLAPQASHLRNEWSQAVLSVARQKQDQGQLKAAITIARVVPSNTPAYSEAQATIEAWETDWQQGSAITDKTQTALKTQRWEEATEQLKLLVQLDNDYWRKQIKVLNAQLATERLAWKQLRQAQDLAQTQNPEDLAQALTLVSKVAKDSYVADKAKAELESWSKLLLGIASERLEFDQFEAAMSVAENIPTSASVYPEAQDVVNFTQARALEQQNNVWAYMGAWALTQQIQPERPLYQQAKVKTVFWEQQVQNLTQLQLANWFASLGQDFSYKLAIEQANMIQGEQPQRQQAQTLIAQWQQQLEKLEDGRYLAQALQLALDGTVESLQTAIAQASQITLGRALRVEAQTLIAEWSRQYQLVQDKPLLERAKAFAQQGQLVKAVEMAQQITTDRPLYVEAQAAIDEWVAQIQRPEDQPILDQATELARQGSLTAAIATATQIGPERFLYDEAQRAIADWTAERDAIWRQRAAAETLTEETTPLPSDPESPSLEETPVEEPATNEEIDATGEPSLNLEVNPPVEEPGLDQNDTQSSP